MHVVLGLALVALAFLVIYVIMRLRNRGESTEELVDAVNWPEAKARAESLLRDILGKEEYDKFDSEGFIELNSGLDPGRRYRISRNRYLVTVVENDRPVQLLCVQPKTPLPDADKVVMHVLMIRANERRYLKVARKYSIKNPSHPKLN